MRIAAAQLRPAWLDKGVTTERTLAALDDAVPQAVDLLAFPETWLAGYPFWLDRTDGACVDDATQKAACACYLDAGVEVGGPEVASVVGAVRALGVFTRLGIAERGCGDARGTVFATLLAVDPGGRRREPPPHAGVDVRGEPGVGAGGRPPSGRARRRRAGRRWPGLLGEPGCARRATRCTPAARTCTSARGQARRA